MIHKWVARMMLVSLTPILALPFDIANTAEAPFIGVLMRLNDGVTLDDLIAEVATEPMGMLPPVAFIPCWRCALFPIDAPATSLMVEALLLAATSAAFIGTADALLAETGGG